MEGIPSNAAQEWKARKEAEAGTAALQAAAMRNRPRVAYTVIPEADLQAALAQHKALMAKREPVEVYVLCSSSRGLVVCGFPLQYGFWGKVEISKEEGLV